MKSVINPSVARVVSRDTTVSILNRVTELNNFLPSGKNTHKLTTNTVMITKLIISYLLTSREYKPMNYTNYTIALNIHSLTKRRVHSVKGGKNGDSDSLNKTDAIIN